MRLTDAFLSGSATSCKINVEASWNGGAAGSWTTTLLQTGNLGTTTSTDYPFGSATSASFGGHTWGRLDFANFQVRLTRTGTSTNCPTSRTVRLDMLDARVDYTIDVTTTSTAVEETDVHSPEGSVLAPQGFWGALQSQGAPNIQGDAYMTYYDTRTGRDNVDYQPDGYYQYAVEFPAGASNGQVWLFDPGFCNVDTDTGTGEYYTKGGSNGTSSFNRVSTFYDLFDTRNTPYDTTDDSLVYSSDAAYRSTKWYDTQLDRSSPETSATPCDDLTWHNEWVQIASNLPGGRTYRLHTHSTDPDSPNDQRDSTALNAFAIWSKANGGTPRVYGLGAMEAYVRLPGGRATEFYLARIEERHAGKTMAIRLWDPGDTGSLAASLQILGPTTSGYVVTSFSYTAEPNSGSASVVRLADRHERHLGDHEHGRHEPVQRLLAEHRARPSQRLRRPAPLLGLGHQRGGLVEDPLQHERFDSRLLDRPHHLAGRAAGQPGPSRHAVASTLRAAFFVAPRPMEAGFTRARSTRRGLDSVVSVAAASLGPSGR